MIFAFVAFCLLGRNLAQVLVTNCSDVSRIENFDKNKIIGKWYGAEHSKQFDNLDCPSITFFVENGVDYGWDEYRERIPNEKSDISDPTLDTYQYIRMKTRIPAHPLENEIIATDYTSYAVMCPHADKERNVIIFTKDQHPTEDVLKRARDILKEKVGGIKLFRTNQTDCEPAESVRHPNVKCYMAHGGLLGVSEGVQAGVPMVIIPMYGDQFHNAAAARSRGVAEVLEWQHLSEDTLRTALDRIFNDTRYEINARALSRAYLDRPEAPLETAVWWTEYVARGNGNSYLKTAAQNLTWYQYYLLDVALFLVIVVIAAAYVNYRILMLVIGAVKTRRSVVTVKGTNGTLSSSKKTVKRE